MGAPLLIFFPLKSMKSGKNNDFDKNSVVFFLEYADNIIRIKIFNCYGL